MESCTLRSASRKMATEWPNIDGLLEAIGVESTNSVAVEPSEGLLYDPFTIMPDYNEHEMTEKLIQYRMMMTLSLSIPLKLSENDTYEAQEILHTTEQAYGETDIPRLVQEGSERDDKGYCRSVDTPERSSNRRTGSRKLS